jgi:hypothetical protein
MLPVHETHIHTMLVPLDRQKREALMMPFFLDFEPLMAFLNKRSEAVSYFFRLSTSQQSRHQRF